MTLAKLLFLGIICFNCKSEDKLLPIEQYDHHSGFLSAYAQRPTDATYDYVVEARMIPPDSLETYDLLIAVFDCSRVGQSATLKTKRGKFKAMVFDCAGVEDGGQQWMIEHGYLAEVDYYFWRRYPDLIGTHATITYE